ncbi:hypothetical protein VXJ89_RS24180, partial [Escherichia coli]
KAISHDGLFALVKKMPGATLARLLQPGQARQGRLIPPHTPDSATDAVSPTCLLPYVSSLPEIYP